MRSRTSSGETLTDSWHKSSYRGGDCVAAVGAAAGMVLVRDTRENGEGPILRVSAETRRAFTAALYAPKH
jgi:hypothetical protein